MWQLHVSFLNKSVKCRVITTGAEVSESSSCTSDATLFCILLLFCPTGDIHLLQWQLRRAFLLMKMLCWSFVFFSWGCVGAPPTSEHFSCRSNKHCSNGSIPVRAPHRHVIRSGELLPDPVTLTSLLTAVCAVAVLSAAGPKRGQPSQMLSCVVVVTFAVLAQVAVEVLWRLFRAALLAFTFYTRIS